MQPPHPDWTPDDLVRAAHDMVPRLRERQQESERLGRLHPDSHAEFVEAGFYRILQPRRFGGYEFGLPAFARVMMEVARGCGSSGWVLALTGGHAHTLSAFFPEQAQIECFGQDGEFRSPLTGSAEVKATPVDGGYRLSGGWNYSTGCDIATHFMGSVTLADTDPPKRLNVLIQRSDFSIVDNWRVIGMQGTGSRRVVVDDVFVPNHRTIEGPREYDVARNSPGRTVHPHAMYRAGRLGSVLLGEMAAVAVGIAQGALDVYEQELCTKKMAYPPYSSRSLLPEYQRHYGEAWALVHCAEATVLKLAEDYMEFSRREVEEGKPFSDLLDGGIQLREQYATKLAIDAVDLMFRTSGTSAAQERSPLQRYFRDQMVLSTHNAAQYDRGAQGFGKAWFLGGAAGTL